jgi:hypothetical protein
LRNKGQELISQQFRSLIFGGAATDSKYKYKYFIEVATTNISASIVRVEKLHSLAFIVTV